MLDSVKLGFSVIRENCDAALVMPVDVPAVTGATVRKIVEAQGLLYVPNAEIGEDIL